MRKIATAALVVLGLVLMSAVPVFASDGGSSHAALNVWATPDRDNNVVIDGSFTVSPGTHGLRTLHLYGLTKSGQWKDTLIADNVNVVQGQTVYQFSLNTKYDLSHFNDYKVFGDDGSTSRTIDRDECGFRVPEAPSSGLLLLGALPAAGIVGAKVAGIRLPRPSWLRIG